MMTAVDPAPDAPRVVTLDAWLATNGPLSPAAALVSALEMCALASRLTDAQLRASIASLRTTSIVRDQRGGWIWNAAPEGAPVAHTVTDTDVIERIGGILFHSLTGSALRYPLPDEQTLRTELRRLRADIPVAVADLTVRAVVSAHGHAGVTLAAFARNARQVLGIERQPNRPQSRRLAGPTAVALLALALVFAVWWSTTPASSLRPLTHGLTANETALVDVVSEEAFSLALIDEHTAALTLLGQLRGLWATRVPPEDPTIAWTAAHEAWVQTLRGDHLTTEQILENLPARIARELGDSHPYTRAVRLALAATLDARGASDRAASLRTQADRATQDLFRGAARPSDVSSVVPVSAGVVAHVAPNQPEREGFRRSKDGYFVPLTSSQRWLAGEHGWRLHLVATSTCRASLVVGREPQAIAVRVTRAADRSWDVQVEGTKPAVTVHRGPTDRLGVSLLATETGTLHTRIGMEHEQQGVIDSTAPQPSPPYTLAFQEDLPAGCQVVWLEIPFPPSAKLATADVSDIQK